MAVSRVGGAAASVALGALDLIRLKKFRDICGSRCLCQSSYQSVRVRCRMMIAAAFMRSRMTMRTMMAGGGNLVEPGLWTGDPVEDLDGEDG